MKAEDLEYLRHLTDACDQSPSGFFCAEEPRTEVLYVDDEEVARDLFARAIGNQLGVHVYTAAGAGEALQILHEHANTIALVVSDIRMPGNDGVWLASQIRQTWPTLACLLTTAYSDHVMNPDSAAYVDGMIEKPWDLRHLVRIVNLSILKAA